MRGLVYCTANSYSLPKLNETLRKKHETFLYQEALYCKLNKSEVFIFSQGCIVFWNSTKDITDGLLHLIKPFENEPLGKAEFDQFKFGYGTPTKVFQDEIILEDRNDILSKLVISYGLAQSVKLLVYENRIEGAIQSATQISQALAKQGRVPLTRRQIGRKIGELFLERSNINLQSAFLDTPEFFWDHPEHEPLYRLIAKDLDIKTRTQSLNRKLEIIHELFQILGDEINHRNSAKLELIIIGLILFEVILGVTNFFMH